MIESHDNPKLAVTLFLTRYIAKEAGRNNKVIIFGTGKRAKE
ncbi:hypothetical protein [Citrobacter sp. NCU1]|nr:hypothetical protein [Citrobacter sp. NCU1]